MSERLLRQIEFVVEIDRLKAVERRTTLVDRSRQENSAEHSWHIALMAVLLAEHARDDVDLLRVVKMLLVHDLVEIDAGDTFCYDPAANEDKDERERRAAERLFALPPADQGAELLALWEEFEARETPEARFAAALDRLQPMLQNLHSEGASWRRHGIRKHQVLDRNRPIDDGSPTLWDYISRRLEEAAERGILER
jgi:putative hydrolase of HD superfamily